MTFRYCLAIISLLFGSSIIGYSQIDSLLLSLQQASTPDGQFENYVAIADYYSTHDPTLCLLYCDTLEELARTAHHQISAPYLRAMALRRLGEYDQAWTYAKEALTLTQELGDSVKLLGRYNLLANLSDDFNRFEEAAEYYLNGIALAERLGHHDQAAAMYYGMGISFFKLNDHQNAQKNYLRALEEYESIQNFQGHARIYDAVAALEEDSTQALRYYEQSIHYAQTQDQEYVLASTFTSLGAKYAEFYHDHETALPYLRQGLKYASKYEYALYINYAKAYLGSSFLALNQLDSARYYLTSALRTAREKDIQDQLEFLYRRMAKLSAKEGKADAGGLYMDSAFLVRESLIDAKVDQEIQENLSKYQTEQKERQLAEQELQLAQAENTRNRILIAALLLLALLVGVYQWYLNRQRQARQATELSLAEQAAESRRLQELDKLKTSFFTNLSHELRTPLTLILGPLEDLRAAITQKPLQRKIDIASQNGQKLLKLVNEIMDLAKAEAGRLERQDSAVALRPMVRRIFASFESLAELRRVKYVMTNEIPDLHLLLDRGKLEKILTNLLGNALKYTPAAGRVSLHVGHMDKDLNIVVRDTGQGIHPKDLPHIFDRYYQGMSLDQRQQGGTGIGLALAAELAELMDGKLSVVSELGSGSAFTLSLPLVEAVLGTTSSAIEIPPEDVSPETAIVKPVQIKGQHPRILIVEDNPDMSRYLLQLLESDYQCTLAQDGQEALRLLRIHDFDCITSDVMMPNMDGFELRERINENPDWRNIPFLMLTARHLEEDKLKAFQLGVDDYINKPFSTRELKARIENLLRNKLERMEALAEPKSADKEILSIDKDFLQRLEQTVIDRLDQEKLKVEELAEELHMSARNLRRIIKSYTGLTTVNYVLEVRLQRARRLLEQRQVGTVLEAQYAVGIQSTSYFTRKFTTRFGRNPSSYLAL